MTVRLKSETRHITLPDDFVQCDELCQQFFHAVQRDGIGTIGFRFGRIRVCFHEETGDANGNGGAGQNRDEFTLSARGIAQSSRQLDRMGGRRIRRAARLRWKGQGRISETRLL